MQVTFKVPTNFYSRAYFSEPYVRPVIEQIENLINSVSGGAVFLAVDYTKNTISINRKSSTSYNRNENKIKSFRAGKEHTITRKMVEGWVDSEKARIAAVTDEKTMVANLKEQVNAIVNNRVEVREVTTGRIRLVSRFSEITIYTDRSGPVKHTPYITTFGVTAQKLHGLANEADVHEKILYAMSNEIGQKLEGFFNK